MEEEPQLLENPQQLPILQQLDITKVTRNILADKPRIVRYNMDFEEQNENIMNILGLDKINGMGIENGAILGMNQNVTNTNGGMNQGGIQFKGLFDNGMGKTGMGTGLGVNNVEFIMNNNTTTFDNNPFNQQQQQFSGMGMGLQPQQPMQFFNNTGTNENMLFYGQQQPTVSDNKPFNLFNGQTSGLFGQNQGYFGQFNGGQFQ